MPSVTDGNVPSRVFAFGGVFGMQRPVVEVVWRVVCAGLVGIGALAVCDFFYARFTQARWFALHVIANAWIALLCVPDLYAIATDPLKALTERDTVNHWPTDRQNAPFRLVIVVLVKKSTHECLKVPART